MLKKWLDKPNPVRAGGSPAYASACLRSLTNAGPNAAGLLPITALVSRSQWNDGFWLNCGTSRGDPLSDSGRSAAGVPLGRWRGGPQNSQ
jgi:hypothetical protein